MTTRKIVLYPDPVLQKTCDPVSEFNTELSNLIDDLFETMYHARHGVGLAAPQIGILQRVTVIDCSPDQSSPLELVNPKIIDSEGAATGNEGCLSIPGYQDKVTRKKQIRVEAQDREGKIFHLEAEELLSVCIQHEIDHLDGILFIDKLSALRRNMFKRWFKKQKRLNQE